MRALNDKEWKLLAEEYDKVKYTCNRCGHKTVIPYNVDKGMCSWCKHYVFKTKEDEDKYRIMEKLRKEV